MTPHPETEFKLRATSAIEIAAVDAVLRELALPCRAATSGSHVDTYFDDGHGSLAAAGVGLRLRAAPGGARLATKSAARATDGLFVRDEHEVPWAAAEPPRSAQELPDTLRDRIEPFVLDRPLVAVLQLATRRDTRVLVHEEQDLCELAVDRVEATAAGATVVFQELELEVAGELAAAERLARELTERLPVAPATDDKPTHAAHLLGLRRCVAPQRTDTLADTIAAAIVGHVRAMRAAEVGVRTEAGDEALHGMRVAVRRLRSLVAACRDLWADDVAAHALEQLAADGRTLGEVRDLDVLLASLDGDRAGVPEALAAACDRMIAWIRGQRDTASAHLQQSLRSAERLRSQASLERDLQALDHASPLATRPVRQSVAERVAAAGGRLRKRLAELPEDLPLEPLHAVRIACKRVRYVAEDLAEPGASDQEKALARLTALQQALGTVCDGELAVRRLLDWLPAATATDPEPAAAAAALGALAMHHARAAAKARKRARRALARADRKRVWRSLLAAAGSDAKLTN
jgi:CHAD domain-containing protein